MKIGLVRRGYSSTGGAENYLRRMADALRIAGHGCTLFGSPEWRATERPEGCGFVPLPSSSPRRFADALASLEPRSHCDFLFSLERVWSCDCYRAGDGVHRAWLERRARFEPAWRSYFRRWNPKQRQLLALERALFSPAGAARVIANSQLVREEILTCYPTYPAERIAVIYNGLPAGAFLPATPETRQRARAALGILDEQFVALFAGTGWERKGLGHALAAIARLPERVRPLLLVAGRGRPGLYQRAFPRAAARTRFLGPVRGLTTCYAAADLFVLPTLYDPFSNACLEALASGLPVLTTDANGFSEIMTPSLHGEIVSTADGATGEALAARLLGWTDPARRAEATARCAARASEFTMERNVQRTLAEIGVA